jgi:dCMP deaminase
MSIDDWDLRFLNLALHVAGWSKDPSTKVGAVLAYKRKVISLGFNGLPPGVPDVPEYLENREEKYPRVVHAEVACLLNVDARHCTLYTSVHPCSNCMATIIAAGVERVVTFVPPHDMAFRWPSMGISVEMANQSGLVLEQVLR